VGKGTLAALWVAQVTMSGGKVLVADAERHPDEWYRRIEGLGGDLALVAYGRHRGGELRLDILEGIEAYSLIVVDSAAYFKGSEDDPWGPGVAVAMQQEAGEARVPMLVLAHVSKGSKTGRAYGSTFWHNVPRVSWELKQDDGNVLLICRKATDIVGLKQGDTFLVVPTWGVDGITPTSLTITEKEVALTMRDKVWAALNNGWQSRTELANRTGATAEYIRQLLDGAEGVSSRAVPTGSGGKPRTEYRLAPTPV
jgi:hypothetical protein